MADIIQVRRDLAANWTSANPTLAQGEMGLETDTIKIKYGDGSTAWNSLGYFAAVGGKVGIDSGATPDYLGAANNDGVLRTDATLDYVDGGNFVTLSLDSTLKSNYDAAFSHVSANGSSHADVVTNSAKDTNVSTDLSEGTSTEITVDVNSSDGTNATLVSASTTRAGLLTKAKWDEIVVNTTHSGTTHDYAYISGNDGATNVTAAELEELTNTSETTLHSHAGGAGGFVNRGDPQNNDYEIGDLTSDGAWHELDLFTDVGVPKGAKSVLLTLTIQDDVINTRIQLRKNGNTFGAVTSKIRTQTADLKMELDAIVALDANAVIEYNLTNTTIDSVSITVKGWWL